MDVAVGSNDTWPPAEQDAAVRRGRELRKRDESHFAVIQHETESRKSPTSVKRRLTRALKSVGIAVRFAFACGLVVPSQGQDILLTRDFDSGGEHTSRISLDATGTYMVGYTGLPYAITGLFIRKTDFAGAELWTRKLGPSSGWGSANGVAASPNGVYAVGEINQPPPNSQLATAFLEKYDAAGNVLWRRQFEPSNRDRMLGVAVNRNSIYVVGEANPLPGTASSGGLFVCRYDAAGNLLWTRQDQPGYSGESAIAADDTGVYVLGYLSRTHPSAPHGEAIFKYDNDGNVMWRKVLSTAEQTEFWPALAVDHTGFYMAGAGSLTKFDTAGNEQWSRKYGAPFDRVELAADEAGVYLAGTVPGTEAALPGQCASGYSDAYVHRYDSGGRWLWTRQFGTSAQDQVAGVAVDGAALWVAGFRELGNRGASFLTKLEKATASPDSAVPQITGECVVNAASHIGGGVAPGEIVTIFGAGIGPAERIKMPMTEDGRIQTTLAETRILFNGVPAAVLSVSATQSSAIVPYAMAVSSSVDVQVEYKGVRSRVVSMPVVPARLGIFTLDGSGRGQATVLNDDGSLNTAENPARQGSVITLFVTGEGLTDPGGVDDHIIGDIPATPKLPLVASMRWTDCDDCYTEILSANSVSGSVPGLLRVKLRVPEKALQGSTVPLLLWNSAYLYSQPGVTIAIQ